MTGVEGISGKGYMADGSLADSGAEPLVSIVVPVYNGEPYLERCLRSVTGQSYSHLQIILVNDGSTDRSGRICEEWKAADPRIEVVHKTNAGLGMARNTGIDHIRGEYFLFVDSDDYVEPQMVRILLDTLKKEGARACYSGCINVSETGERSYGKPPQKLVYDGREEVRAFMKRVVGAPPEISGRCFAGTSVWGNLYETSLIKEGKLRFQREQDILCEDVFFNIAVYKSAGRIAIAPHCLYYYCVNGGSLTQKYREDRFEALKNMRCRLELELKDEILEDQEMALSISRSYMDYLPDCIKQEIRFRGQFGKRRCLERLKKIAGDETTVQVLKAYPVRRMKPKQRVLFSVVRSKKARAIYWLFRIRYRI